MDLPPAGCSAILYLCLSDSHITTNTACIAAGKGDSMAQRKKILLFEGESLLTASILSLMAPQTDYEVFSGAFNTPDSLKQLNGYTPDVFIIERTQLAENITVMMELVDRFPGLRLIVIGLDDNRVNIFERQIVHVEQFSDFLAML
jgi:hypothetical protein